MGEYRAALRVQPGIIDAGPMIRSFFRLLADSVRLGLYGGLFMLIMAAVSYFAIGHYIQGEQLPAPNLVGMPLGEALKSLVDSKTHLSVTWGRWQPDSSVPENTIVDQSPKPGTLIKDGTPIRVVISTREVLVTVPDLRDETRAMAGIKLRDLGLDVGSIGYIQRDKKEGGLVLNTDPPPGTGVVSKSKVNLLLSAGAEPQTRKMPTLIGLKPSQALELLTDYGLQAAQESAEPGGGMQPGRIYRQEPAPGDPITPATPITVVYEPLAEGEEEEEAPSVDLGEETTTTPETPGTDSDAGVGFQWLGGEREDRSGTGRR